MGPKSNAPSKKTEQKQKQKIIEDKTFGLKNKNKSAKVGKYVATVEKQVKESGVGRKAAKEAEVAKAERERQREETEKKQAELATLFKPVVAPQKIPFGVDPKGVLCAAWKASGTCAKGDRCRFSHDPAVERRAAKINVYTDARDSERAAKEADTMDTWDTDKLQDVVRRKQQRADNATDIVCKYFLDAIEQRKYGWFWECPNGGDQCKYRHALPPGYVLRRDLPGKEGAGDDDDETHTITISLEEFLESERFKIDKRTPVTAESFATWKTSRKARAAAEQARQDKEREAEVRAGRLGHVSGRDLFTYQPDLFRHGDDEEAMDDVDYAAREDEQLDTVPKEDDNFDAALFENLEICEDDEQN